MQHTIRRNVILLIAGDVALFISALFLTLTVRHGELPSEAVLAEHLVAFLALTVLWVAVFFIAGLYDTHISLVRKRIPDLVLKAQIINILLAAVFFFVLPVGIAPKTVLALYLVISTILIILWRLFVFPFASFGNTVRAMIVGNTQEAYDLERLLNENTHFRFMCAEVIDTQRYADTGSLHNELITLIAHKRIDLVIGDMRDEYGATLVPLYYNLVFLDTPVRFMSLHDLYEQLFHRVPPTMIGERWLLENISQRPQYLYDAIKRSIDLVGALLLAPLLIAAYPCVAIAVFLADRGPIFIRQERVGQYNRPIYIRKFRTMTGVDFGNAALNSTLEVTPLGAFMRTFRIDELPQLINIFRGDLSFIGPRPEIPSLAHVYAENIPYYTTRHLIKPGLSGWAQINNYDVPRGGIDIPRTIEKLSFDLYYLKRRSFLLDVEIMLKTIKTVLSRSGT